MEDWVKSESSDIVIRDNKYHQLPDGSYVPRVSSITSMYPRGEFYDRWLGDSVSYDDACKKRDAAADAGTRVHNAIAGYLLIKMATGSVTIKKDTTFSLSEWSKILSFAQFMKDWRVRAVEVEKFMSSSVLRTAGTADLFCYATDPKDKGEVEKFYCVDWKSGSGIHHNHKIQVAAYGQLHTPAVVDGLVVRLGSQHRCGYEVQRIEPVEVEGLMRDWEACYHFFVAEHGLEPRSKRYPSEFTL